MTTLSLAMIVRNNADTLQDIIPEAIACGVTEIVIVDTAPDKSDDGTYDIAWRDTYGLDNIKFLHFPWIDDFAAARNFAFENTHGDFILWLDSDDRIPERSQEAIAELVRSGGLDGQNALFMQYAMFDSNGNVSSTFIRERIISREAFDTTSKWVGRVHECIAIYDPAVRINEAIEHKPLPSKTPDPGRNLRILDSMYEDGDRSPRTLFYYARELYWNGNHAKAILMYERWITTSPIDWELYSGRLELADCYAKMENEKKQKSVLLDAIMSIPSRAEAWVDLGKVFYDKKEWAGSVPFFRAACGAKRPESGFVNEHIYGTLPYDYLATSLSWSGETEEAYQITKDILLPANPVDERILGNISFYERQLNSESYG